MKIPEHVVLEDVQCKGYRKKVIKLENGSCVDMRIPDHTPEEERELSACKVYRNKSTHSGERKSLKRSS